MTLPAHLSRKVTLTAKEVGDVLGLHERTVRRRCRLKSRARGRIPTVSPCPPYRIPTAWLESVLSS